MNLKKILILTSLLLLSAAFPLSTLAQESANQNPLSLSVSPPVSYVHVKPGGVLDHTVELRNTGNSPLQVRMNITNFVPDGETGRPILGDGSVFDKLINPNLEFGKPFTIKPGENRTVNLKLQISKQAKQQEYPLSILFTATALEKQSGQTQFSGIVGSNLILFVSAHKQNLGQISLEEIRWNKWKKRNTGQKRQHSSLIKKVCL